MTPAPIKPSISFEYLEKIDIRVGTILAVEDVANSDKLVRLKVDFGDHTRSILIGMKKERQNPKAEIEGKQALFVVNLESRKMAGELSEGMVFDIGYADKLVPVLACLKNLFLMEPALVKIGQHTPFAVSVSSVYRPASGLGLSRRHRQRFYTGGAAAVSNAARIA